MFENNPVSFDKCPEYDKNQYFHYTKNVFVTKDGEVANTDSFETSLYIFELR